MSIDVDERRGVSSELSALGGGVFVGVETDSWSGVGVGTSAAVGGGAAVPAESFVGALVGWGVGVIAGLGVAGLGPCRAERVSTRDRSSGVRVTKGLADGVGEGNVAAAVGGA